MNVQVIYGPPGTGKTRRLMEIINEYTRTRLSDACVLFCSHTRAAAQEAATRWGDTGRVGRVDMQTIHATCFRAHSLSKAQTVDDGKLKGFGEEFGIEFGYNDVGREYLEVFGVTQVSELSLAEAYDKSGRPGTFQHFLAFATSYKHWKDTFGFQDFNDMLGLGAKQGFEGTKLPKYNLLVIDEAQDLTPLHWQVIEQLCKQLGEGLRVVIALDDDQTIFAWQGADPHGAGKFGERHGAQVEVLEQSWRVPHRIYQLADRIIRRVRVRKDKNYRPRDARGHLEHFPAIDYIDPDPDRDNLIIFADRFVRKEVERSLLEHHVRYHAVAGFPAPLDTKGGKAYEAILHNHSDLIMDDDALRKVVRSGLNQQGIDVWDRINPQLIMNRVRRGDLGDLQLWPEQRDYLRGLPKEQRKGRVRISTFHGAKGMEADDVHLVLTLSQAAWNQSITDPDSLHRLLYVAVTRSRDRLFIYEGDAPYEMPELPQ